MKEVRMSFACREIQMTIITPTVIVSVGEMRRQVVRNNEEKKMKARKKWIIVKINAYVSLYHHGKVF